MPSRSIDDLQKKFRQPVRDLLSRCCDRGHVLVPYETLRTPQEQAAYWRRGRATRTIMAKVEELRGRGCDFLADCIEGAGPQHGKKITNALPGQGWHQWGLAVDCFVSVDGRAMWADDPDTPEDEFEGYRVYADVAADMGLDPGGHWTRFKDWPHVQWRPGSIIQQAGGWEAVDAVMRERFGDGLV